MNTSTWTAAIVDGTIVPVEIQDYAPIEPESALAVTRHRDEPRRRVAQVGDGAQKIFCVCV